MDEPLNTSKPLTFTHLMPQRLHFSQTTLVEFIRKEILSIRLSNAKNKYACIHFVLLLHLLNKNIKSTTTNTCQCNYYPIYSSFQTHFSNSTITILIVIMLQILSHVIFQPNKSTFSYFCCYRSVCLSLFLSLPFFHWFFLAFSLVCDAATHQLEPLPP